jgi:exoribonuclease-2
MIDPAEEFVLALKALALGKANPTEEQKVALRAAYPHSSEPYPELAFKMMVDRGVWSEHEDLLLLEAGLPRSWSAEALAEAAELTPGHPTGLLPMDRDEWVTGPVLALDDEGTVEVDDALAVETLPDGGMVLHIFISDPASYLKPGGALDREARERGTTVYHPTALFPMLPLDLSARVLSLDEGALRPALDFSITFDAAFRLRGRRVQPVMTRVSRRLTYVEADALLATGEATEDGRALGLMVKAAEALFADRISKGAFPLRRREYRVRVEQGQVQVRTIEPESASRKAVAEAMIAACGIAGDYFSANRVPALFRRQDPPSQPIPWSAERSGDPVWVHRQLTTLRRVYGSVEAGRHFSLGSSAYCQITSPLRRYGDLAMQRQLLHHAATGTPYYSANEIWALSQETEAASKGGGLHGVGGHQLLAAPPAAWPGGPAGACGGAGAPGTGDAGAA